MLQVEIMGTGAINGRVEMVMNALGLVVVVVVVYSKKKINCCSSL